jgi:GNAT superfamily N-acetyltransferase
MKSEEILSEDQPRGQKQSSTKGKAACCGVTIRPLDSKDSIQELTDLLHLAYKLDEYQPYEYPMAKQSEETTRMHIKRGDCWIAELEGRIIGLALVWPPAQNVCRRWYRRWYHPRQTAYWRFMAVHPDFQNMGIGTMLTEHCEQSAVRMDAWELTGCSPVGSRQLSLYKRKGFKVFRYVSFSDTNYYSVVFSKWVRNDVKESLIRRVVRKVRFYKSFLWYKLGILR